MGSRTCGLSTVFSGGRRLAAAHLSTISLVSKCLTHSLPSILMQLQPPIFRVFVVFSFLIIIFLSMILPDLVTSLQQFQFLLSTLLITFPICQWIIVLTPLSSSMVLLAPQCPPILVIFCLPLPCCNFSILHKIGNSDHFLLPILPARKSQRPSLQLRLPLISWKWMQSLTHWMGPLVTRRRYWLQFWKLWER